MVLTTLRCNLSRPLLRHFLGSLCSGPLLWSVPGLECHSRRCHLGCHGGCHLGVLLDPSVAFGGHIWLRQSSCEVIGSTLLPSRRPFRTKKGNYLVPGGLFVVSWLPRSVPAKAVSDSSCPPSSPALDPRSLSPPGCFANLEETCSL